MQHVGPASVEMLTGTAIGHSRRRIGQMAAARMGMEDRQRNAGKRSERQRTAVRPCREGVTTRVHRVASNLAIFPNRSRQATLRIFIAKGMPTRKGQTGIRKYLIVARSVTNTPHRLHTAALKWDNVAPQWARRGLAAGVPRPTGQCPLERFDVPELARAGESVEAP
jgi:hypothetical protein